MTKFTVPTRKEVSPENQALLDNIQKSIGRMPNLYAAFAHHPTALADYLALQSRATTLSPQEVEVINLIVSQVNACDYCVAGHTYLGKMVGFTEEQLMDIRRGHAPFDAKLDALVRFAKAVTIYRGRPGAETHKNFYAAGYTHANLIDVMMLIGDKIISNYLQSTTKFPLDWPPVPQLENVAV